MLVLISREKLEILIEEEIRCWESVSGGPNPNAFSFDPKTTDPKLLKELGYYDDRESWIAGARVRDLREYLTELRQLPQFTGK
jgi:hypothetical protein